VNEYLASCYGEHPRVTYLDIGSIFFKGGELNAAIYYDPRLPQHGKPLHPDTNGQRMMAESIEPTLARLMWDAPLAPLASMTDINTALIPVERLEMDSYDWYARHHAELKLQKTMKPQVVLIGDSITHFWGGEPTSNHSNGPYCLAERIWELAGDEHGLWLGPHPKRTLAVAAGRIRGTRAALGGAPDRHQQSYGLAKCALEHARRSCGRDRCHLPRDPPTLARKPDCADGGLPRGAQPGHALRDPIAKTNNLLAQRFAGDPAVTYLDIGARLLAADGTLSAAIMPDGTHPSDDGYQIWRTR